LFIVDFWWGSNKPVFDFELRPESTKLEALLKILAVLHLELYVSKRGAALTDAGRKAGSS
jgi:HTH-type transcriptional regulator/antitoxin HipB